MVNINRFKIVQQFMYFGASGSLIFCTNLAVTAICRETIGIPVEFAYVCGFVTTIFVSFILCRHVIFDAVPRDVKQQFLMFLVASISFRGFEYLAVMVLYGWLHIHYLISLVSVQLLSFGGKFFYYRSKVFAKQPNF